MSINEGNLLNTVLNVFIEKGFTDTSTRELAERAGIAELTLFRKYGTKKELFSKAVMNYLTLHVVTEFDFSQDTSMEQSLARLLTERYQFVAKGHAVIRMLIAETLLHTWPEEFNVLNQMHTKNRHIIAECAKFHKIELDDLTISTMMNGFMMSDIIQSQHNPSYWSYTDETNKRIVSYVHYMIKGVI